MEEKKSLYKLIQNLANILQFFGKYNESNDLFFLSMWLQKHNIFTIEELNKIQLPQTQNTVENNKYHHKYIYNKNFNVSKFKYRNFRKNFVYKGYGVLTLYKLKRNFRRKYNYYNNF